MASLVYLIGLPGEPVAGGLVKMCSMGICLYACLEVYQSSQIMAFS